MSRWRTSFSKSGLLMAVCRLCGRVASERAGMTHCPAGCQNAELKELNVQRTKLKMAPGAAKQLGLLD